MHIIKTEVVEIPSQHNGTICPRLGCIIIPAKGYNTPQ